MKEPTKKQQAWLNRYKQPSYVPEKKFKHVVGVTGIHPRKQEEKTTSRTGNAVSSIIQSYERVRLGPAEKEGKKGKTTKSSSNWIKRGSGIKMKAPKFRLW